MSSSTYEISFFKKIRTVLSAHKIRISELEHNLVSTVSAQITSHHLAQEGLKEAVQVPCAFFCSSFYF